MTAPAFVVRSGILTVVMALLITQAGLSREFDNFGWAAEPDPTAGPLPNAERPLSHEELLAIRGAFGGRDVLTTLVAEATIERRPRPRAAAPGRRTIEGFGSLPRTIYPGDPVVEAQAHVRAGDDVADGSAVEGLLAMYIDSEQMIFRGEVATPAGSYLTPISATAMALADDLPENALILVRGSLSSLAPEGPCPKTPTALRGRGFGGSPFDDCPAGWLTAKPIAKVSALDPLAPVQFGIRVQGGARADFWRRYDEPYVEPTTYLLQHVSSPLVEQANELRWKVIGVVDAIPAPESPSALVPETTPTGLEWSASLGRLPPSDTSGGWNNPGIIATAWHDGFAFVHQGRDRVLTTWVSADGLEWRSASLPRGIREVEALLRLDDGLVIIADEANPKDGRGTWQFEVWRSEDGLDWEQVSTQRVRTPARFTGGASGYYRIVQGYWSLDDRIVAHETYTTYRCCGRSPGLTFLAADRTKPVTFAWTSSSGADWRRARVDDLALANGWSYRDGMHAVDGSLYALAEGPSFAIDRSSNGVRWKRVGQQPQGLDFYSDIALTRTPAGYVLGGTAGREGVVWFSTDLRRWEQVLQPAAGFPVDVVAAGQAVVVVGGPSRGTGDASDRAPSWLAASTDGGRSFDPDLGWQTDVDWCDPVLESAVDHIILSVGCPPPGMASKYATSVAPASTASP